MLAGPRLERAVANHPQRCLAAPELNDEQGSSSNIGWAWRAHFQVFLCNVKRGKGESLNLNRHDESLYDARRTLAEHPQQHGGDD